MIKEDFENLVYLKTGILSIAHKTNLGHDIVFSLEYASALLDCAVRLSDKGEKINTSLYNMKENTAQLIQNYLEGDVSKIEVLEYLDDILQKIDRMIKKIEEIYPED